MGLLTDSFCFIEYWEEPNTFIFSLCLRLRICHFFTKPCFTVSCKFVLEDHIVDTRNVHHTEMTLSLNLFWCISLVFKKTLYEFVLILIIHVCSLFICSHLFRDRSNRIFFSHPPKAEIREYTLLCLLLVFVDSCLSPCPKLVDYFSERGLIL